jgi:hypothetical protein
MFPYICGNPREEESQLYHEYRAYNELIDHHIIHVEKGSKVMHSITNGDDP